MRIASALVIAVILGLYAVDACDAAADLSRDMERLERLREAVDVQADRIDYAAGDRRIVASGAVRIALGARTLFADEVSVDLADQIVAATGQVVLVEGTDVLEGDRIEYNYRTNTGVITNGRGTIGSGVSFSGTEIRREGERQYAVKEGRFTACRVCQPEPTRPWWEFRASQATIYQDEWIASRDTSFWIKGVPALYSPVFALPIGPRRTGFLIPRFAYGNSDGFAIKQPFFWAISRSQDATLTTIYRTKRGFEFDGQYRYILGERSRGDLRGRYLHDWESGQESPDRGEAHWLHDQMLSPTWSFKADANYQSDIAVVRDFVDKSVAERTQPALQSNVFLAQTTPQYMFQALVAVTEGLTAVGEQWFSRLPELQLQWLPTPVFGLPLVAEGNTTTAYFLRSGFEDAGRFDLYPVLRLPVPVFPWLASTTSLGFRETAYTAAARPGGDRNRFLVDLGQRFGSTFLRRFEAPGFGFTRLTHVVDAAVQYQYVPWVDQQSLLQFDSVDFVSPQNRVTFQLTNRLMGRSQAADGAVRTYEVASLTVAQSVNLQPTTREFSDVYLEALTPERVDQAVKDLRPLPNGFTRATERRVSNLVFQAALRPLPAVALYGTVALNVEQIDVEGINSGVEGRLWEDLTLTLGQSYLRDRQVDGIVATMAWKATKNIALDLLTRYDVHSGTFLENTVNARVGTCCWDVGLRFTRRTRGAGQSDENSVQVTFDLKASASVSAR
jgi:LPS-assembly protein